MKIKIILCSLVFSFFLGSASHSLVVESFESMEKKETERKVEGFCIVTPTDNRCKYLEPESIYMVLNCIQPIKPILPIKPIWCSGTWTFILQCDQYCNCRWVPTCIQ